MTPINGMRWHHPRSLGIAMALFGIIAVPIGLAGPESPRSRQGLELSGPLIQQERADVTAGFPAPPHPDATPRGPAA